MKLKKDKNKRAAPLAHFWKLFRTHSHKNRHTHPRLRTYRCVHTNHTSYNSFYKWTKILSLEIIIFELKNDGKKWSRIYFEID